MGLAVHAHSLFSCVNFVGREACRQLKEQSFVTTFLSNLKIKTTEWRRTKGANDSSFVRGPSTRDRQVFPPLRAQPT